MCCPGSDRHSPVPKMGSKSSTQPYLRHIMERSVISVGNKPAGSQRPEGKCHLSRASAVRLMEKRHILHLPRRLRQPSEALGLAEQLSSPNRNSHSPSARSPLVRADQPCHFRFMGLNCLVLGHQVPNSHFNSQCRRTSFRDVTQIPSSCCDFI